MRITALVKSREHVCCRYRIAPFRARMEQAGHTLQLHTWSRRWLLQQILPSFLDETDVLIVQRKLFASWQLNSIRRSVEHLIFDFDDAIFLHNSYDPRGQGSPRRLQQFKQMMQVADVVIAGNEFLREQALRFTEPHKVHLIPTCVEVGRYALANHDFSPAPVQLVWIGSSSTLRSLDKIRSLLNDLGKKIPRLELKVVCDRSIALQTLPVRFSPWQEATETQDLAQADIGISWLPEDAWSDGKCGLKVLQYMAAGLPVVANPVGVQKEMVRHGETGFLVETPQEWHQAVQWLASDPELRRTMGRAGRRFAEAEYQLANGEAGWQRVLHRLATPVLAQAG